MKPDGVATAALEPMETLDSNPANEAAPPAGQEPDLVAVPAEEMPQHSAGDKGEVEPQANQGKETPAAKTGTKASGDTKAKATNKAAPKTKPSTTSSSKAPSGPRSNPSQSRLSNGSSKPQTNGVVKKTTPAAEKKGTPTSASIKKPTGTAGAPASKTTTKVGEKKAPGTPSTTNNAKSTAGAPATKKTPSITSNGVKSSTAVAAKKPPASKPASAAPTKNSSVDSSKVDKPPVSKTTRSTVGTAVSSRPATGSSLSASTAKNSTATSKPATPKTASTSIKTATPKSSTTTPSSGKPPASQSRNTTPVKKDVTKPATPAARKPVDSPLTRPSSTAKSTKPETPKTKSDVSSKKPPTNKAVETKTPNRSKPQESKPMASKDTSKTTSTKTANSKASSPKKTVGSTTPTPVKRGPKVERGKETGAVIAAAATIATAASVFARPEESQPPAENYLEPSELTVEAQQEKIPEHVQKPTPEPVRESSPEPIREPAPEPLQKREPTPDSMREPTPEPVREPTPEPLQMREPTPELVREPTPEPLQMQEQTPELVREPTPEPLQMREQTPEPVREPTPEPLEMQEPTPEPIREPTPEPVREPTPEPLEMQEPTPEPVREPTPEPLEMQEPTPEPIREPTPEPVREPTPEPLEMQEPTPEPIREPTPEPVREPIPEPLQMREPTPELFQEQTPEQRSEGYANVRMSPQMTTLKFEDSSSVPSLGTTVMSPPCSPPGPSSPVRESQNGSSDVPSDSWDRNQSPTVLATQRLLNVMTFQAEEKNEKAYKVQGILDVEKEKEEQEELVKEPLVLPTSTTPEAFSAVGQPHNFGALPLDNFIYRDLVSPHEKEEAVEKADEEVNEDDDDDEYEEERRPGHQLSSLVTDMSTSQPSDEFQVRSSAFGGSAGWHADDLMSGMDSEDMSSCTSSRQQGVSDLSSTQHTAILEGTQSSDALIDSSLRGSEGEGNLMGSPNVETLANEEEEDEDDERVDDMDLSSEQAEEHHKVFQDHKQEEEDDDDVEMYSEGMTESGHVDDDFNKEEHLDNLPHSGPLSGVPRASSWGQTNPFSDTWAQPASLLSKSSPSPLSDHYVAESETPTQAFAQPCVDSSAPFFPLEADQEPQHHRSAHGEGHDLLAASSVGISQSGTAQPAHSGSETSTPEDLRDYDSSSGVESHSDKQQTPVPASVQPDMDQDLGIHLEKGDGEEEEAETLPADEVLGTGPPTASASVRSSPSSSGDDASDTEGEIEINDPEAPMMMDERASFESPPPTCSLLALEEDEEAADLPAGEGEEDGGGATPQSANSVASYGFDCTTSNSNAHSMAESCGKSPGIFSLENEEQLPEEAKDPSLIKELTLPSSAAASQAKDLLGSPVNLIPLGCQGDCFPSLNDHHSFLLGGNVAADHQKKANPLEGSEVLVDQECGDSDNSLTPYFSTICDKTDSFLEGEAKTPEVDEDYKWQTRTREDNRNQNHSFSVPIANGHYLALVPGNRRPIDPTLAEHFSRMAPPPFSSKTSTESSYIIEEQLRRLEQHRQEQERQKRQWLEEERLRLEQQKQLEKQRRELLQLQLQQQQQEHRHRRQVLQWQLELEHQYRMQQKQIQQQQQLRRSPTGVMLSPSSGLCTIYEAMETSDEEDEVKGEQNTNIQVGRRRLLNSQGTLQDNQRQLHPVPPQDLEWNKKVDMVQQLINQSLMLSGDGGCPPLLLLPVETGGTLSPLKSSMWPNLPQFNPPTATVTSVSSYSPDSRGSSPAGDWTVVEVETQH
ncbi:microtubule-associated protein futsch-like isoform X2 [Girardinichthys multiradiatus]|uniref:microtubule-associated protein futsch-like isoform X2 n=1 Tax=Girardinichthys multiradiatus TaxID=208333 RepID=UPI001FACECE1|nr:microtubule-associated protein futsch-like isoform X2 [Girardinichthys multiradiatus]